MDIVPRHVPYNLTRAGLMARGRIGLNIDRPDTDMSQAGFVAMPKDDILSPARIMQTNLSQLFCETDPDARNTAYEALWRPNAVIYHREEGRAGRSAILAAAEDFSERMKGLSCAPMWPVSSQHDLYILRWIAHDRGSPLATGCQVGFIVEGRIHAFYMIED